MRFFFWVVSTLLVLAGCGQKGALYLPDDYTLPEYRQQINGLIDQVATKIESTIEADETDQSADNANAAVGQESAQPPLE